MRERIQWNEGDLAALIKVLPVGQRVAINVTAPIPQVYEAIVDGTVGRPHSSGAIVCLVDDGTKNTQTCNVFVRATHVDECLPC